MPKQERIKTRYPGVYYINGVSITSGRPEKIYYIVYRLNSVKYEEKAGRQFQNDMTPAKASMIRARRINNEELSNTAQRKKKNDRTWTFENLWHEYKVHKTYIKRLNELEYNYRNHLKSGIGNKTVDQIKPVHIENIKKKLLEKLKPATVTKSLQLVSQVINYGAYRQLCPTLGFKIKYPKFDNTTTEDLTPDQLETLLTVIENDENIEVAAIMKLALYSGMRKSEMLKLQWSDVDFERGFIYISRDPKGIVKTHIPMNDSARAVLQGRKKAARRSKYVFPSPDGGIRHRSSYTRPLQRIRKRAGLPDSFRPLHGLRHVYASILASSGKVDMYTLQKLLTHKSPAMTQRYAHLRDEALKKGSSVIDEIFKK